MVNRRTRMSLPRPLGYRIVSRLDILSGLLALGFRNQVRASESLIPAENQTNTGLRNSGRERRGHGVCHPCRPY